jgi:hypothetical protein
MARKSKLNWLKLLKPLKHCLLKLCDQGLQIASRHSRVHP